MVISLADDLTVTDNHCADGWIGCCVAEAHGRKSQGTAHEGMVHSGQLSEFGFPRRFLALISFLTADV